MHATAQALLDAHTRHVLSQLSGDNLAALLSEEAGELWDWLSSRPANAVADEVRVRDLILRNVLEIAPSEQLLAQIGALATRALENPINRQTKLEDLLNVREYDLIVDRLIALEDLRRDLVHGVMKNPSVTKLVSDLVYNGVKNYMSENGGLAKKVPGMSSLMKMGKGVMEKVGADDALDNALRSYISRNTRSTMEMSEQLVNSALETPKLKDISRQFWQAIKSMPLGNISRHVKPDDVEDVVAIGATVWNHFRQTTFARDHLSDLVHTWFERWGNEPASAALESIGFSKERLQKEAQIVLPPLVNELMVSGHLETRVRVHLERFYGSIEVSQLLGE